ncbi:MAG: response regulator [Anaerolineales bacterium]|nr:response regulator [Anaerolineales bacterium]
MAKILIVDDDLQTTTLIEGLVKHINHQPFSVNESKNALKAAEDLQPDLILLDIMMGEINGIALCKLIKSTPHLAHIPIIMVSALDDIGSKKDSANAGANDYITKPLMAHSFAAKVTAILG